MLHGGSLVRVKEQWLNDKRPFIPRCHHHISGEGGREMFPPSWLSGGAILALITESRV